MLVERIEHKDYTIGIWKITEPMDELFALSGNIERYQFNSYKSENRLKEKLAIMILLRVMLGEDLKIEHLATGKPYLKDSHLNISISHTEKYVALLLSESERIGVDIEMISEQVTRVRKRFISEKENIDSDNELLHLMLHWSAKETVYKALNEKGLNFREDILLDHFNPKKSGMIMAGEFYSNYKLTFNVEYIVREDYVLTYTLKSN